MRYYVTACDTNFQRWVVESMANSSFHPLPRTFTALIGREYAIEAICAHLRSATTPILTLTGPAGVGKTRLAIAAGHTLAPEFADGIVYVDLAALRDANHVLPAVVRALGLPDGEAAARQLARYFGDRSLLLVLDNFEHVLDAGPPLNAALADAPGVRVLVTSQAPLHVSGEWEYAVEPLSTPPPLSMSETDPGILECYRDMPALQLFVDRARHVRPSFELTTGNLPAVVAICHYLDGLPLAIELAAARSNLLSPAALLHRLRGSLHLLSGGPRDAPARHQALRTALEWSYGLLAPREALLLDRLALFRATFTLAAAEAVAGSAPIEFPPSLYVEPCSSIPADDAVLDTAEIFDLLGALVDHSLVQHVETGGEEPRFRLFEIVRQLAAAKLTARGETDRTALRHAIWFHALAESAWGADGVPTLEHHWLEALDADLENLRAALDFFSEHDPASAANMASALVWFYYTRADRLEGIRAIERVMPVLDRSDLAPAARARIDFSLGSLLIQFPATRSAGVEALESALAEFETAGLSWGTGYTLVALSTLREDDGDYPVALGYLARARPSLEAANDPVTLANVDFHTAVSLFGLGRFDEARALASTVAFSTPDRVGLNIGYALHLVGMIDLAEDKPWDAARRLLESGDFSQRHSIVATTTELLDAAATLHARVGDPDLTARLFGAADRYNRESGHPITYPERTYYDAARDRVRAMLGSQRFEEQLAAGARLSLDAAFEAMREALRAIAAETPPAIPSLPIFETLRPFGLTSRELDVLRLVASGKSDREIADSLFISYATARTHVRNILGKMDVPNRSAATSIALRERLVDLSEGG